MMCTPCEDLYSGCCTEQHEVCSEIEVGLGHWSSLESVKTCEKVA